MRIYTSLYSSIDIEPEKKLMRIIWFPKSADLDEEGVKKEINKILDYLIEYPISNIIVDSRQYPFRANETIQHWINHIYMPQIIDVGIKRYAIIVEKKVTSMFETFEDTDDMEEDILVEYFSNTQEAEAWIVKG